MRRAGLYVAADFADPETGEPDGDAAIRVVSGLRERRVLISATGPHGSTLKIRPPLPFARPHVDQLADRPPPSGASTRIRPSNQGGGQGSRAGPRPRGGQDVPAGHSDLPQDLPRGPAPGGAALLFTSWSFPERLLSAEP